MGRRGSTVRVRQRHFNGQSTVTIDGDRATGESYTIAHHLFSENGNRKIMIASLRYLDTFAKIDGSWYVPPGTWRGYEAGPEGLEILVIGAPNLGEDPREDVDGQRDWWAD